jgi:hypothetical protein
MSACCDSPSACVFARVLLARDAVCTLARRRSLAERELVECSSPVAHTNCGTLAALMHERARLTLKLPRPEQPLTHAQALRLHCGALAGLREALGEGQTDVHRLVTLAHERHGSLTDLPWQDLVASVVRWQPRPRRYTP